MSDTILSAIIGVAGTIVGAVIGSFATYLITRAQWKRDEKAAGVQWEHELKAALEQQRFELRRGLEERRSDLIDRAWTELRSSLTPVTIDRSDNDEYMDEIESECEDAIKFLWGKGDSENNPDLCALSDQLATIMRAYIQKLRRYRAGHGVGTRDEIEALRQSTKNQVGTIIGMIRLPDMQPL